MDIKVKSLSFKFGGMQIMTQTLDAFFLMFRYYQTSVLCIKNSKLQLKFPLLY